MSSSTYETLQIDQSENVLTITMDRPERRNALNLTLDEELRQAFAAAESDDVRAVVLRANGPSFCAGADLNVLQDVSDPEEIQKHVMTRYLPLIEQIVTLEKPVVAAINGSAAGAGMALALACDLRVMADDANMVLAFSRIGFVPDSGASWLLVRQVGYSRAFEMAAEAEPVAAERCKELGLTNRVVPAIGLHEETHTWAKRLAQGPTLALGLTKRALQGALERSLIDTIEMEARFQKKAAASRDHREGLQAFKEKRAPDFEGR